MRILHSYGTVDSKAFTILLGGQGQLLDERSTECLLVTKAGDASDPFQWHVKALEVLPRCFYAQRLNPARRGGAELRLKLACEGAGTHRHNPCKRRHIQFASKVILRPRGKVAHTFVAHLLLLRQQGAVLCLAARTP